MSKNRLFETALETAKDLKLDLITIHEIEALNIPKIKQLTPAQIKRMRAREKVSQAVMARLLNVTPSTYQKWERGEVIPKGANLKLLDLARRNGIDYLI